MSSQREFSSRLWEPAKVVLISDEMLRQAVARIVSCEACKPDTADVLFDSVLDSLTGNDPRTTEYHLPKPALCPNCVGPVVTGNCRVRSSKGVRKLVIQPGTLVGLKNDD